MSENKSSPLLFFVALGFGIVFTNLWIILGIKYCCRYRRRRQLFLQQQSHPDQPGNVDEPPQSTENIAMIAPAAARNRTHTHNHTHNHNPAPRTNTRRRREKKLMSLEEVNAKFPVMQYSVWRAQLEKRGSLDASGEELTRTTTRVTDGERKEADVEDAYAGHTGRERMSKDETSVTTREVSLPTQGCSSPTSGKHESGVFSGTSAEEHSPIEARAGHMSSSSSSPLQFHSLSSLNTSNTEDNKNEDNKNGTATTITIHELTPSSPQHNHRHHHRRHSASHFDSEIETASDTDSAVSSDDDNPNRHETTTTTTTTQPPPDAAKPDPDPDPDTCAICIDTLAYDDDIRGLTCNHAFHASCLDPWLTNRRACCPLCKADYHTPKQTAAGGPNGNGNGNGNGNRNGNANATGGGAGNRTARTGRGRPERDEAAAWVPSRLREFFSPGRGDGDGSRDQDSGEERRRRRRRRHQRQRRMDANARQQMYQLGFEPSPPRRSQQQQEQQEQGNQAGQSQPQPQPPAQGAGFVASITNRLPFPARALLRRDARRPEESPTTTTATPTPRQLEANTHTNPT